MFWNLSLFAGETLAELMKQKNLGKQSWRQEEICRIIYQILCGLNYLHQSGIVHRVFNEKDATKTV